MINVGENKAQLFRRSYSRISPSPPVREENGCYANEKGAGPEQKRKTKSKIGYRRRRRMTSRHETREERSISSKLVELTGSDRSLAQTGMAGCKDIKKRVTV